MNALPENLKPLTSLRWFAAMWVVMFHYWPKLDVGFTPGLVQKGYLGVELFFVLSGFILSHVYLEAHGEGRFKYSGFLWARLARVYPLHLATLFGVIALGVGATAAGMSIDANILDWTSLPANLLMVHAWGFAPEAAFNHPSWSISAEWFAYLCFPAFAWVAWRLRRNPGWAVGGALVLIFALYAAFERLAGFPLTQATIAWGALRIVPCFAFGCAMYLAWRAGAARRRSLAAGAAAVALLAILASASLGAEDAAIVGLFGFLIVGLAGLSRGGAGALSSKPFVYLGEVSYSVYMICVPWKIVAVNLASKVLDLPSEHLPLWAWLGIVAAITPLAMLSYHLVEKPAREAMKRHAARRSRDTVAPQLA
jgi:peptidoglycan/LPS O-acetylase OafA/YrhL